MKNKKILIVSLIVIVVIAIIVGLLIWNPFKKPYEVEKITQFNYFTLVKDGKIGIIDNQGNILIEPTYDAIKIPNPSKPVFICVYEYNAQEGSYQTKALNDKNEEIFTQYDEVSAIQIKEIVSEIPYEKRVLKIKENNKYGLIDFDGNIVVEPIYDQLDNISYKEGQFLVKKEDQYGVINDRADKIVDIKYDSISGDNYYSKEKGYQIGGYIVGKKTQEGYRYGYLNDKGKTLLQTEYNRIYRKTEIKDDKNIYLVAEKNGQAGLIKNKKVLIPHEYDSIEYDDLNQVFVLQKGRKYGVFDKEGKEVLGVQYDEIAMEGIYIYAQKDGKTSAFDTKGNQQENLKYKSMILTDNEQYQITIDQDDKYGVVEKGGKTLIPNKYAYIEYVYKDYFIVGNEEGKSGIINAKNEMILDIKYDVAQRIEEYNLVQAIDNNTIELYDENMKKIASVEDGKLYERENYIEIYSNQQTKYFSITGQEKKNTEIFTKNQLFAKEQDGKWGFVDKEGNAKVSFQYQKVTEFNEYGFAGIKQNGKWGVMKQDGSILLAPTYSLTDKTGEPNFIGSYYKVVAGYGEAYYTDEKTQTEE